jgi:hypothetical protein
MMAREESHVGLRVPVIASEAKQSRGPKEVWIASSPSLLAMTENNTPTTYEGTHQKEGPREAGLEAIDK